MMKNILLSAGNFLGGLSWKIYAGIAALVLLGGTLWYCNHQVEERVEQGTEIGRVEERNEQLEETIKNVEKADEARKEIAESGPAGDARRYDQCLRTARNPENCERWLP